MEKGPDYYQKDARNILWAVAFTAFIPTLFLLLMMAEGYGERVKWDAVTFGMLTYSVLMSALAIVAGIKCGQGKKSGRTLAFIPTVLQLLNFPFGTIFAVAALIKINKQDFVATLN